MRRAALIASIAVIIILILLSISVGLQAQMPTPTGADAVGRTTLRWVDEARAEPLTDDPDSHREVIVSVWYPAEAGTGTQAPYFPNLDVVSAGLRESGEVSAIEVAGLPLIRSHERLDAEISSTAETYPVILLSPGNATNVEFYAALAGDLASHGYIVVGINHPYDVAAVALSDGSVAVYNEGPFPMEERQAYTAGRMTERVADMLFVLDQLERLEDGPLAGHLDLEHVAAMGHSLGGITAAQACTFDDRIDACLNIDGLQNGGPFAITANPDLPSQPFMFLTKEESLHPKLVEMLEALPTESYMVTVHGASHDSFTDGPAMLPSLLPLPNKADRYLEITRAQVLAFMDQTLKGQPNALIAATTASPWVTITVFEP